MNRWNQYTLFRLLVFYVLGILLQLNLNRQISIHYSIFPVLFFLILISQIFITRSKIYKLRWLPGILLAIIMIAIGFEYSRMYDKRINPLHLSHSYTGTEPLLVQIKWQPEIRANSYKALAEIIAIESDSSWVKATGNALLYFPKESNEERIAYGDKLIVYASLREPDPPANPHEFDYSRFLHLKNIQYQSFVKSNEWATLGNNYGNPVIMFALKLRKSFINIFENQGISGRNFAVVTALVLGMDDYLDNDTRKEFSSAGAIHILCVSGLHVGVIYMVLNALLFFLKRNKYARALRSLILLIGIWFYAMLTGLAPAVLRAATMFSFVIIGTGIKRKAGVFNSLTVSAFILLLFNPFLIYNVGFQLSYAAVIAIVAIQPTIYQIWRPKNKIADNIWGITTVSVAAQLGTAPLGLFYFHQFPNYFIITNLIAIPLATLILYAGFLSVILSPLTIVAKWITWLLILMLKILNQSVTFIDNLPYSVTTGLFINLAETIILFLIIFTVFRAYLSRKPIFLHFSLLLLILFAVSGTIKQYQRSTQKQLTVYSINRYSVIDLITGRNSILLADSLVLKDPASIEFQVSNHHVYKGINQEQIITFNDCFFKEQALSENIPAKINCPLIQFDNRHILLVDKDLPTWNGDSAYNLDLLILIDNNNDAERVLKNYKCANVVITGKVSPRVVQIWKEKCTEAGISCHAVKEQGAFTWDLYKRRDFKE